MRNAIEYAKYFIKNEVESDPDTFDGNMKIQKLLFFSNLINNLENGQFLFSDDMLAFKGGTVIEPVRLRYKENYQKLKEESQDFEPDFTIKEYDTLNTTIEIFGKLPAKELSELNHQFNFWKESYENSKNLFGFHDKSMSVIPEDKILAEIDKLKPVLTSYRKNKNDSYSSDSYNSETIHGITFYFNSDEFNKEEILPKLLDFSTYAEESTYTLINDEGELMFL